MRWLALLFGIYILFLGIVPCADGAVCDDLKIETAGQHNEHKESEHKKQCTPFCTCNCCHTSTTISAFYLACNNPICFKADKPDHIYLAAKAKDIATDILRPPCMI